MESKESYSLEHQAGSIIQSQSVGLRIRRTHDVTPTPRPKASELLGLKAGEPGALCHSRRRECPISLSLFFNQDLFMHIFSIFTRTTQGDSHTSSAFLLYVSPQWTGLDLTGLDDAHPHWGGKPSFSVYWFSFRNTPTDISRSTAYQLSGHPFSPVKLTQSISHHSTLFLFLVVSVLHPLLLLNNT